MNTFNDFIDVTEYLIAEGYTAAGKIAINGGSADGANGAVINMRPELYGCVVADVPFVDVINTISDASLPLTPPGGKSGVTRLPQHRNIIRSYSTHLTTMYRQWIIHLCYLIRVFQMSRSPTGSRRKW